MRGEFHYAIVDEVDSVLVDDCRNPFLISVGQGQPPRDIVTATQVRSNLFWKPSDSQ